MPDIVESSLNAYLIPLMKLNRCSLFVLCCIWVILFVAAGLGNLSAQDVEGEVIKVDDEELSKHIFNRILFSKFTFDDQPLILVLETLRHHFFSINGGSPPPLEFRYEFNPEVSFHKISFTLKNANMKDFVEQLEAAAPIKFKAEGAAWIFVDAT